MANFKKGMRVVKTISIMGTKTASIQVVESVKKGVVKLVDCESPYRDENGREIDPAAIPGCYSEIIYLEE